MIGKAADDLDRHEQGGDGCGQPRFAFRPVMAMAQKDMVPRPAAMIMHTCRPVMAMVVMVVVMPVMDVTRMNMLVRHGASLTPHTVKVV